MIKSFANKEIEHLYITGKSIKISCCYYEGVAKKIRLFECSKRLRVCKRVVTIL